MEHVSIYFGTQGGTQTNITPHQDLVNLPHVFPQTFSFRFNFPNIQAIWGNNKLYLSPLLFITLPDGLYTINSLNNNVLLPAQADTKFYKIGPAINGMSNAIYQFNSTSDRLNFVNYAVMAVSTLSILNKDVSSGLAFFD